MPFKAGQGGDAADPFIKWPRARARSRETRVAYRPLIRAGEFAGAKRLLADGPLTTAAPVEADPSPPPVGAWSLDEVLTKGRYRVKTAGVKD